MQSYYMQSYSLRFVYVQKEIRRFLINGMKILNVTFVCTISNFASGVNFRGENLCGTLFLRMVEKKIAVKVSKIRTCMQTGSVPYAIS